MRVIGILSIKIFQRMKHTNIIWTLSINNNTYFKTSNNHQTVQMSLKLQNRHICQYYKFISKLTYFKLIFLAILLYLRWLYCRTQLNMLVCTNLGTTIFRDLDLLITKFSSIYIIIIKRLLYLIHDCNAK